MATKKKAGLKALKDVLRLFSDEGRWIRYHEAINSNNMVCSVEDPDAQRFCLMGAINHVTVDLSDASRARERNEASQMLFKTLSRYRKRFLGKPTFIFVNDHQGYEAVLELLHLAIEEAEG